jgi:hypothetical protein
MSSMFGLAPGEFTILRTLRIEYNAAISDIVRSHYEPASPGRTDLP